MSTHIFNSLRLFLSEYTLVFVIMMVIYSKYFVFNIRIYSVNIPLLLIPYVVLSVLLIISNYSYYHLLRAEEDKENPMTYHVIEVEDMSVTYTNNIIMNYVLALLPVFQATLTSLIVFAIVLTFIFGLSKDSKTLFFNPILFLMNCKVYRIRVEEHNKTIYIIYKEKIQEGDYIRVHHLYENIYLDERIIKKKKTNEYLL